MKLVVCYYFSVEINKMEKFVGVWAIKESENFDDYMKAVGL